MAYILVQSKPTAATSTSVYTVASDKTLVFSSISVANISNTSGDYISLAIVPSGGSLTDDKWFVYNQPLVENIQLGKGVIAPASSQVYVRSEYGYATFTLNGMTV